MKIQSFASLLVVLTLGLVLPACQKEIQLDLKEAATQYVLEGNFDDSTGFSLRITQSKPFYDDNTFNPISTALVELSDDKGNFYTIPFDSSGLYQDTAIKAIPGNTYTVKVTDNGKTFEAVATVPQPTPIKKVTIGSINFGGGGPGGNGVVRFLQVWYDEHPGVGDHYRVIYNNPKDPNSTSNIFLQDDRFGDGIETQILVFAARGQDANTLQIGDTIYLSLQSIDKACYDYFYTLDNISGSGGAPVTPADPTSNWSNKALGVFTASSVSGKRIIIDK